MSLSLVLKPLLYSLLLSVFVFASLLLIQGILSGSESEEVAQSSSVVTLAGEEDFSAGDSAESWQVNEWSRKKSDSVSPEDFIESEDALGKALYLNGDGTVVPAR